MNDSTNLFYKFLNNMPIENFKENVLDNKGTVLLDFWADWCAPCKMFSPVIDKIAQENPNVTVGKVNIDNEQELAQSFRIQSIPTCVVIKDGVITEKKRLALPKTVTNVIKCKNPRCITQIEQELDQVFMLTDEANHIYRCKYCEEKY